MVSYTRVANLNYYNRLQIVQIFEHQTRLSRRLKSPVTFNSACHDWVSQGYNKRFRDSYYSRLEEIERYCQHHESIGDLDQILTMRKVHELLGD